MKTAAAYIRVSTDDQLEYSPDSQLKMIRDFAEKNGMVLPDQYIFQEDDGVSGKRAKKRAEFMRMIGTAKKKPKPFDCILLWKFSRFARNRVDSVMYKSLLRKQLGIEVISISEPLGDDKMSIIVEAMIEAMDEYYSINLAEEVRRGMNEKVSRGEPVTAPAFGYTMKNKQFCIDPKNAGAVKMIFQDYGDGMSCRAIAEKLNGMGIRTRRRGLWENRTVEYLLHNPVYIGKIRWNPNGTACCGNSTSPILTDGAHEHLIDDDLWQKVQQRLARNRARYGRDAGAAAPVGFSLQGLVKCSACGATMTRSAGGSMQCQAYAHGKCSVSHGISAQKLEEMILTVVEANLKYRIIVLRRKPDYDGKGEEKALEKQLIRENQKMARVQEAYECGADSLEEYRYKKQKIAARIRTLQDEKKKIRKVCGTSPLNNSYPSGCDIVQKLRDPNTGAQEKNLLLHSFIEKIVFDRKKNQIELYFYL